MFINIQNLITLGVVFFCKISILFASLGVLLFIFVPKYKNSTPTTCRQHVPKLCCFILCNSVKSWGVEVNPHKSQFVLPFKI